MTHLTTIFPQDVAKLKRRGGWKHLSMRERGRLLGSLDGLDFSFFEAIRKAGTDAASQAWLWQLTESLPLLAAEPEAMKVPVEALAQLQKVFKPLDEQVRAGGDRKGKRYRVQELARGGRARGWVPGQASSCGVGKSGERAGGRRLTGAWTLAGLETGNCVVGVQASIRGGWPAAYTHGKLSYVAFLLRIAAH